MHDLGSCRHITCCDGRIDRFHSAEPGLRSGQILWSSGFGTLRSRFRALTWGMVWDGRHVALEAQTTRPCGGHGSNLVAAGAGYRPMSMGEESQDEA